MENLTLKMIAVEIKIKSPSLYNYVDGLDEKSQIESAMLNTLAGVSGYDAFRRMNYAFYNYVRGNKDIFNLCCSTIYTKRNYKTNDESSIQPFIQVFDVAENQSSEYQSYYQNAEKLFGKVCVSCE